MITSPNMLRRDTVQLLKQVDAQIAEVEAEAGRMGIEPVTMRDANGSWVMIPLLLAKMQGLALLVQLNDAGKKS
jgi:hypothetical protein